MFQFSIRIVWSGIKWKISHLEQSWKWNNKFFLSVYFLKLFQSIFPSMNCNLNASKFFKQIAKDKINEWIWIFYNPTLFLFQRTQNWQLAWISISITADRNKNFSAVETLSTRAKSTHRCENCCIVITRYFPITISLC